MVQNKIQLDLHNFLTSSATTVEWMSDELRRELSIQTGLEKVVLAAIHANRSVVIAGTAGSGKTHLIRMAGTLQNHVVVPDLAALPDAKWETLFSQRSPVIVAGNEGAFLAGMRREFKGYDVAIDLLHAVQSGEDVTGKGPVVIDAAGYDPAGNHAIAEMLRLPILTSQTPWSGGETPCAVFSIPSFMALALAVLKPIPTNIN